MTVTANTYPTVYTDRGEIIVESVYVAGPMTGHEHYNFPAFRAATEDLRERGFNVYSPVELDEAAGFEPGITAPLRPPEYYAFLERDITLLASGTIDAGVFLPEWQRSHGARLEYAVLQGLGLATLSYPTLEVVEYRPAGRRQKA